ncbi:MAG: hypothetical protein OXE40_06850, partial [Gammaproteobacteria bacterium]|nr:hypothetical protein [Gammaproteobacteria bacterium]
MDGDKQGLEQWPSDATLGERAYLTLLDMARRENETGVGAKSDKIVKDLKAFDLRVDGESKALIANHGLIEALPSPPAPALPTAATTAVAETTLTEATPVQAETTGNFDWIGALRQLQQACDSFRRAGVDGENKEVLAARDKVVACVKYRFNALGGDRAALPALSAEVRTRPEQHYRAIEAMYREARDAKDYLRAGTVIASLKFLHDRTASALRDLTNAGASEILSILAAVPGQLPPMTGVPNPVLAGPLNQESGILPPAVTGNAGRPQQAPFVSAVQSLLENKRCCTSRGNLDEAYEYKLAYNRVVRNIKSRYRKKHG